MTKCRCGQSRILEAVIGAIIIFIVFSVATFLIRASDVRVLQERGDLDRLGYNVLSRMVDSGTIESLIEIPRWDEVLRTTIQKFLPSTLLYNLTIFDCVQHSDFVTLEHRTSVSNVQPDAFLSSKEVSSTSIVYTSKRGNIYCLVLLLTRAGGE